MTSTMHLLRRGLARLIYPEAFRREPWAHKHSKYQCIVLVEGEVACEIHEGGSSWRMFAEHYTHLILRCAENLTTMATTAPELECEQRWSRVTKNFTKEHDPLSFPTARKARRAED